MQIYRSFLAIYLHVAVAGITWCYYLYFLFLLFYCLLLFFFLISKGPTMYLIRNRFVFNYTFKGHVWLSLENIEYSKTCVKRPFSKRQKKLVLKTNYR